MFEQDALKLERGSGLVLLVGGVAVTLVSASRRVVKCRIVSLAGIGGVLPE